MLKRRLIPKLQMKQSRFGTEQMVLVTTVQFDKVVEVGDPVSQKIYQRKPPNELIFLDLDATPHSRKPMAQIMRKAAEEILCP